MRKLRGLPAFEACSQIISKGAEVVLKYESENYLITLIKFRL